MTISPSSPRPHQLPTVAPAAPVIPEERNSSPSPLDLLLITSESDFPNTLELLSEEAARTGIHFDVIRIEELEGATALQKFVSLYRRIGKLTDSKKLQSSSAICVTLHGTTRVVASDVKGEKFLQQHPDLADFASYIELELGEESGGESGSKAATNNASVHVLSACNGSLTFPSLLLMGSARQPRKVGDDFQ